MKHEECALIVEEPLYDDDCCRIIPRSCVLMTAPAFAYAFTIAPRSSCFCSQYPSFPFMKCLTYIDCLKVALNSSAKNQLTLFHSGVGDLGMCVKYSRMGPVDDIWSVDTTLKSPDYKKCCYIYPGRSKASTTAC
jgi:hypothetical protein